MRCSPTHRSSRDGPLEGAMEEKDYDEKSFSAYSELVDKCVALDPQGDVAHEYQSIILKMKSILSPDVRPEVDYEEAYRDVYTVYMAWSVGNAVGKSAFVLDVRERDSAIEQADSC